MLILSEQKSLTSKNSFERISKNSVNILLSSICVLGYRIIDQLTLALAGVWWWWGGGGECGLQHSGASSFPSWSCNTILLFGDFKQVISHQKKLYQEIWELKAWVREVIFWIQTVWVSKLMRKGDLCFGVQFLATLGQSVMFSNQHSFKTCEHVLLGEGGRPFKMLMIILVKWCRNMHCLLKTSAGKAAIVIMLKEIVTFMTVRFQLFLQSTFKSQHFPSVKWLQFLFARWCPFSQRTAAQMKMNQERNLKQNCENQRKIMKSKSKIVKSKAKLWNLKAKSWSLKAKLWNQKQNYEI